jgi:hypothetical protein
VTAPSRLGADLCAEGPCRGGERLRDPAHASAREAPRADAAVAEVSDVVVRDDVRRPRRARTGPRADDRGDGQHAAHRVGLEGVLDEVGRAAGEQSREVDRLALVDGAQLAEQARLAGQVGRTA